MRTRITLLILMMCCLLTVGARAETNEVISECTPIDLLEFNEGFNNVDPIILEISSSPEHFWCNHMVSRANMESISIETTGYGQVQAILEQYSDICINTISVCGPMDKSDFRALWSYISQKGLETLDLTEANIANNEIPYRAFYDPIQFDYGLYLEIKKIILPEGLLSIGSAAFAYTNIEDINIPSTVRHIGSTSFGNCKKLNCKIVIPEGVEEIDTFAFTNCVAMTEAPILPQSLKRINQFAFYNTAFNIIEFPNSLECIKQGAFARCGLTEVNIPNSCTTIEDMVFQQNEHLHVINLPDNMEIIPMRLFANCYELERIHTPSSCKIIGEGAFTACISLKEIELNEGIETIEKDAFLGCNMETVSLPSSVVKLEDNCLLSGSNLKTVYCMATVPPECATDVFKSPENCILYVPIGTAKLYREQIGWNVFKTIEETDKFPISNILCKKITEKYKNDIIYDLTGRKISNPIPNQTYIKDGRKFIYRIK